MASYVTDYGQDYFAGMIFGTNTKPASYYVALCTQVPSRSTDGTTLVEPVGSNYARKLVANNGTIFGTPAGGVISNITAIDFGVVATADWPVLYAYAICDAATAGNVYLFGTLRVPRAAPIGHQVSFDIGLITFSINSISQTIIPSA
jgi:hypothetical protein